MPYPLLSDFPEMKVTQQYAGLSRNPMLAKLGIPERAFFLIDRQGIIRQWWLVKGGEGIVFSSEPLLKAVREIAGEL